MEMIGKVRRMHRRDKKSVREIAKATGLSRNTVAKWVQAPIEERPKYRRTLQPTKLTPFHEAIKQALARRCAPTQARTSHGAGAARRTQGRGLRRRLQPAQRLHPRVA